MMNEAEQRAVAQAITDAHAHKPGLDSDGRMEDAKTIIAAFDAIEKFRATKSAKAATRETQAAPPHAPAAPEPTSPPATPSTPTESTATPPPVKAKAKGKAAA